MVFRMARKAEGESDWTVRMVSSDICGVRDSVINDNRAKIIRHIRMIYCIVESRSNGRGTFSVDDVVNDFRMAASGDCRMAGIVERAKSVFPLRADLVSVGNEFKRDFSSCIQRRKLLLAACWNMRHYCRNGRGTQASQVVHVHTTARERVCQDT